MHKIKTTLLERFLIGIILPQQGSYIDNIVKHDLDTKLKPTQSEMDKYGIVSLPNGGMDWNADGHIAVFDIELTEREYKLVKSSLEMADTSAKLPFALNPLFATICKPTLPEDMKPKTTPEHGN